MSWEQQLKSQSLQIQWNRQPSNKNIRIWRIQLPSNHLHSNVNIRISTAQPLNLLPTKPLPNFLAVYQNFGPSPKPKHIPMSATYFWREQKNFSNLRAQNPGKSGGTRQLKSRNLKLKVTSHRWMCWTSGITIITCRWGEVKVRHLLNIFIRIREISSWTKSMQESETGFLNKFRLSLWRHAMIYISTSYAPPCLANCNFFSVDYWTPDNLLLQNIPKG